MLVSRIYESLREELLARLPSEPDRGSLEAQLTWCRHLQAEANRLELLLRDSPEGQELVEGRGWPHGFLDLLRLPVIAQTRLDADSIRRAVDAWQTAPLNPPLERNELSQLSSESEASEWRLMQQLLEAPENINVHRSLADYFRLRAEDSPQEATSYWRERCSWHDTGDHVKWLEGRSTLSFDTTPSGARIIGRGPAGEQLESKTPFGPKELTAGTWTLDLKHEHFGARLLVELPRSTTLDFAAPVQLVESLAPEWCHVPAGPFLFGGDPSADYPLPRETRWLDGFFVARFPVTLSEYIEFLNALYEEHPQEAVLRVPRRMHGGQAQALIPTRPDREQTFELPPIPEDLGRRPVVGVSHEDAEAYAAWRSRIDNRIYRLPTEVEWEKAARGVDGRYWPWGNEFDPALTNCRHSLERPVLLPVGSFPGDCSPYGVRDMAGNVLEWCRPGPDEVPAGGMPIRGGSWHSSPQACRSADRFGCGPHYFDNSLGFRLSTPDASQVGPNPSNASPILD